MQRISALQSTLVLVAGTAAAAVIVAGCLGPARSLLPRGAFPKGSYLEQAHRPGPAGDNSTIRLVRDSPGRIVGQAIELRTASRSGPFKVLVFTDVQSRVKHVAVKQYLGPLPGQFQKGQFLRQFAGKGPADAVRLGLDIDAVTGATITSRAVAVAVRRAISASRRLGPGSD